MRWARMYNVTSGQLLLQREHDDQYKGEHIGVITLRAQGKRHNAQRAGSSQEQLG